MSLEMEQSIMPLVAEQIEKLLRWFVVGFHAQVEVVPRSLCSFLGA